MTEPLKDIPTILAEMRATEAHRNRLNDILTELGALVAKSFLNEILATNLLKAEWTCHINEVAYSFNKVEFFMNVPEVLKAVQTIRDKYNMKYITFEKGDRYDHTVQAIIDEHCVRMTFGYNADIAGFVNKHEMNIKFKNIDEKIAELVKIKTSMGGAA